MVREVTTLIQYHEMQSNAFRKPDNEPSNIEIIHFEKDLGVNVGEELSFEEHIQIQTKKQNKFLGMMMILLRLHKSVHISR